MKASSMKRDLAIRACVEHIFGSMAMTIGGKSSSTIGLIKINAGLDLSMRSLPIHRVEALQ